MAMKYVVELTPENGNGWSRLSARAAAPDLATAARLYGAQIRPRATGPGLGRYDMPVRSLESWRKQLAEQGPEELLEREYPPRQPARKLDGKD